MLHFFAVDRILLGRENPASEAQVKNALAINVLRVPEKSSSEMKAYLSYFIIKSERMIIFCLNFRKS